MGDAQQHAPQKIPQYRISSFPSFSSTGRTLWRRMKPRFRACKTSRAEKIYLCGMVLKNDKYNVESLDNRYTHVCNTLTTTLLQQKYHLQMFPCRSKNMEQPDYYISKTGYNEVSPSLILLKGVEEEGYGYNIWVEARITLSKNDMTHMKMARGLERDQRFHQELHDLAVGLA